MMCECAQAEKLCVPIQPGSYLGLTLYLNVPAAETMNLALSFFFFSLALNRFEQVSALSVVVHGSHPSGFSGH